MTSDARERILNACYKFLLPIARLLLANGIGYREFDDACKRAFVQTASTEFGVRGRETNISRVSAMTGIPRKKVQELKKKDAGDESEPQKLLSPLADLLRIWATSKDYQDEHGRPLDLELTDTEEQSFSALVKSCMGDVPPGAVKKELLRLGVASTSSSGSIVLQKRSLIPTDIDRRIESSFVYSLSGLANTIAHNNDPAIGESDRIFERFVESRPMSRSRVLEMRAIVSERLTEISEDLDRLLNEEPPTSEATEQRRVGIGLYFCE